MNIFKGSLDLLMKLKMKTFGTELTQDENIQRQPSSFSEIQEVSEAQDENIRIELTDFLIDYEKAPIIHKVPHRLREVNKKAYEPNVISIGPYHHGKVHLKEMEDIKKSFFDKTAGHSKEILRAAIREDVERIRKCYVQTNRFTPEQFVEMVVLDGFFIVELFRGTPPMALFQRRYFVNEIFYDLLLLENQLPFFVLEKIYEIMTKNEEEVIEFADLVLRFSDGLNGETKKFECQKKEKIEDEDVENVRKALIGETKSTASFLKKKKKKEKKKSSNCPTPMENIKHLLGLMHDTPRWRPSNGTKKEEEETKDQLKKAKCGWKFILYGTKQEDDMRKDQSKKAKCIPCGREQEKTGEQVKRKGFIRCASELEEAGISFEKRDAEKDECNALDIQFKCYGRKAKLRIPKLNIDEHTERMLSNLIAFEQFLPSHKPTYVLDYVKFLDQLIDTKKDVQLLCNSGIFENMLGDDEIVAQVFNQIGDHVYVSGDYHYSDILKQVNNHYNNSCNRHMANLNRNYFNTPWALVSFLAAVLLLFLTFAQTTFTLMTVDCRSCVVLSIVCGVLLVVIALFSCWCFS